MGARIKTLSLWHPKGGDLGTAYDWYMDGNRSVDDLLCTKLGPQTLILRRTGYQALTFAYMGPEHLTAKIMGEEFRRKSLGSNGVDDIEFRRIASENYFAAYDAGNPIFDVVSGTCSGNTLRYQRLILPLQNGYSAAFLHLECRLHALE